MKARAASPLSEISLIAVATASGLRSHGYGGGKSAIAGRRSQTTTSRGASSAKRSRTMNSSTPRASESLADAAQSIAATSSPGTYGRDPATSDPRPRRTLRMPPNERPTIRRRWTSGNVRREAGKLRRRLDDADHQDGRAQPGRPYELTGRTDRTSPPTRYSLAAVPNASASSCSPGRGATSRHWARNSSAAASHPVARACAMKLGANTIRWKSTGMKSRSTSPGVTYVRPESSAHARAARSSARLPRTDEPHGPALHDLVDVDRLDGLAQLVDLGEHDGRPQQRDRMRTELLAHDLQLVVLGRIAERGLEEEAVELRLGKRERSLLLDRVLRREQEERGGQGAGDAVDGDLVLGHRLQQGRLGLRHRAVDLVDQHDVGEDRPGAELEVALPLVEDREARHVGRLQVRRALDTR